MVFDSKGSVVAIRGQRYPIWEDAWRAWKAYRANGGYKNFIRWCMAKVNEFGEEIDDGVGKQ